MIRTLLAIVFIFFSHSYVILQFKYKELLFIQWGDQSGQTMLRDNISGRVGPTSFFVGDDNIYILDFNKKHLKQYFKGRQLKNRSIENPLHSDLLFGNFTKPEYFVVSGTKTPIPVWSKYLFSIIILLLSERYFLRFNFRLYRKKRVMDYTPSSKMRSVAIGLVEIKGEVEKIDKILKDPFDHMECIFYYVMIEKFDIKNEIWVVKHDEQRSFPFFLSDETGSVFIPSSLLAESYNNSVSNRNWERKIKYFGKIFSDYSESKIKFENSYEIDVESVDEIPKNIKKYCENNDIDYGDWPLKENRIRCTVAYVKPNDQLYILGEARILEDSEKELIHLSRPDDRFKIEYQNDVRVAIEHKGVEFFYVADTSEKEIIALLNGIWLKIVVTLLVTGWLIWSLIILN